jgi:hypothetical protein
MTKDDWYFAASTIIGLVALLGIDWKLVRGRVSVGNQKRQVLLLVLVAGSLVSNAIGWYRSEHKPTELSVTISAYVPAYPSPMRVVKDQAFENTDVPLDGYDYDHVTFTNVCFLYDGGAYELQNVTLKDNWRVCTKDERLKNYNALMDAFKMFGRNTVQSFHNVVKPQ